MNYETQGIKKSSGNCRVCGFELGIGGRCYACELNNSDFDLNKTMQLAKEKLAKRIYQLSDVGDLFDGHDELNEYTCEDNNKLMESALDQIHELAGALRRLLSQSQNDILGT